MKKRILLLCTIFSLATISVFAGEVANFEILGFNNNNTYFAFAEYGINNQIQPYANIFVVDIAKNEFLPNGTFQNIYPSSSSLEQSGKSALYKGIINASNSLKSYNINPLNSGNLIYILLDSEEIGDVFSFTDHKTNTEYSVTLNQDIQGVGVNARGAFDITLNVKNNTTSYSQNIGNKNYYRNGVALYKIRSIYSTSNNQSLIFVVEKTSFTKSGDYDIHYMVETVRLQ